jgi:hypothetical protein
MHVRAVASIVLVGLTLGAATAAACGGGPGYLNLVTPVTLKPNLRAIYLKAHPHLTSAEVVGPIAGRTFYGSDGTDQYWAVATFAAKGNRPRPTVFWQHKHAWHFVQDSQGTVCETAVPYGLLYLWNFNPRTVTPSAKRLCGKEPTA